jgi:hypothetical protein
MSNMTLGSIDSVYSNGVSYEVCVLAVKEFSTERLGKHERRIVVEYLVKPQPVSVTMPEWAQSIPQVADK